MSVTENFGVLSLSLIVVGVIAVFTAKSIIPCFVLVLVIMALYHVAVGLVDDDC